MIAVLVAVLTAAALWPTGEALHARWIDTQTLGDTHGYLVVAVSLFLLWKAGRDAGHFRQSRSGDHAWIGVLLLAGGGLAWLVAVRAAIGSAQFLIFPALLWLAILGVLGPHYARRSLFPLGYLYFAMPVWGGFNPVFQSGTVLVVRAMLRLFGIPSHFEGNFVQIPAGTFEIAGGCSGMHFFVVAMAIAVLMGHVRQDDWRRRMKLLVMAGSLALLTNWIRVFTIILAGHQSGMQHYLVAKSHYGYGWVLFSVAMAIFFLLERGMSYAPRPGAQRPETRPAGLLRPGAGFATAILLAAIAALQALSARPARAELALPVLPPGWHVVPAEYSKTPVVLNGDAHQAMRVATPQGAIIDQHDYLFLSQRQGKELGGYNNDILAGEVALSRNQGLIGGQPITLFQSQDEDGALSLVGVSYSVNGRHFAAAPAAQLRYALASILQMRSVPSKVTVWRAACSPTCIQAEEALVPLLDGAVVHSRGSP